MVSFEDNENEYNQNGFNLKVCDPKEKQVFIRWKLGNFNLIWIPLVFSSLYSSSFWTHNSSENFHKTCVVTTQSSLSSEEGGGHKVLTLAGKLFAIRNFSEWAEQFSVRV